MSWEPITKLVLRVLQPRRMTLFSTNNQTDINNWTNIKQWAVERRADDTDIARLEVNFILGCFPDMWRVTDWNDALGQFKQDLATFGIAEV